MIIRNVTRGLLGSIFPQPVWAPPREDGGGDDGDSGDEEDDGQGDERDGEDDHLEPAGRRRKGKDSGDDDEISLDDPDFLEQFYEDANSGDDGEDDAGDSEEEQKALGLELKGMIDGFQVTEDMIPDDFDPSDPKQFRDVVGKIQRTAIQTALKAMFKPMAAALNQQTSRMRKEMSSYVDEHSNTNSVRSRLLDEIPAAGDRKHRKIVGVILEQAKSKFPANPDYQIRSARKALNALGITKETESERGEGRPTKAGRNPLDMFAPLPKPRTGNRSQGRMRDSR